MAVTKMLDSRVSNRWCASYMTGSGSQAWLHRCRHWSAALRDAPSMKAVILKPQCKNHCYQTFGVAAWWFYQHWDHNGVGSIPKCGQSFGLLWPLYETHHGYMTPNQTVKTVAKFLLQGYISIFGAPAKLLSDPGTNFESNIIRELCKLIGIWKVRSSPYHAQTNGQVEQDHQMLMLMIGKLSKDHKVDWPKHFTELVHIYNSMRSAITGYSPHYLMFGCWSCLSIDCNPPQ